MVIDTSAVLAILFGEPEAKPFAAAIAGDPTRLMSVASVLEASIVAESELGDPGVRELDLLLVTAGVEAVPVTVEQMQIARMAYRHYGKGRHAAGLNFGDCFSYALARSSGEALLFKGKDFSKTDVRACPSP